MNHINMMNLNKSGFIQGYSNSYYTKKIMNTNTTKNQNPSLLTGLSPLSPPASLSQPDSPQRASRSPFGNRGRGSGVASSPIPRSLGKGGEGVSRGGAVAPSYKNNFNNLALYDNSKWHFLSQISQHNKVMYDRIQQIIFNIRENLNINGQLKARPIHLGHQKWGISESTTLLNANKQNLNNNNSFWVNFGKTTREAAAFSQKYQKNSNQAYRLYWAIHKSNLGLFERSSGTQNAQGAAVQAETLNKRAEPRPKDLWTLSTKDRDQSKNNKTKKILFNLSTKFNSWTTQTATKYMPFLEEKNGTLSTLPLSDRKNIKKIKLALLISERKQHQKEQKLNYLGFSNKKVLNLKKQQAYNYSSTFSYWWNASHLKLNLVNNIKKEQESGSLVKTNPSFITPSFVWISTFIFHFCAFASLISISQVRDYIKFCLIVVSKLSPLVQSSIYIMSKTYTKLSSKKPQLNQSFHNPRSLFHPLSLSFSLSPSPSPLGMGKGMGKGREERGLETWPILNKTNLKPTSNNLQKPISYYMLISVIKKPFLFLNLLQGIPQTSTKENQKKIELTFKPIGTTLSLENENIKVLNLKKKQTIASIFLYYSLNSLAFSFSNLSYLTYSYFQKSLNLFEMFVRSIYTFLEKPGELIIDWIAYFFLVEWSSDLTKTIPDTIYSIATNTYMTKFSRSLLYIPYSFSNTNLLTTQPFIQHNGATFMPFGILLNLLSGSLIQRRILSMYQIFLNIISRPDTDIMIRQQKGHIFMDIWSDLLIEVALYSNINISECSNLKEEQNRLLEQLLQYDFAREIRSSVKKQNKKTGFNLTGETNKNNVLLVIPNSLEQSLTILNQLIKPYDSAKSLDKSLYILPTTPLTNRQNIREIREIQEIREIRPLTLSPYIMEELNSTKKYKLPSSTDLSGINSYHNKWKRWSANQFCSYQGKDTELFIDLHPPKSFSGLTSIKYSNSIQQPIGMLLCQVFSGIFYKQISKNLLVIGHNYSNSKGNTSTPYVYDQKSLLIQAIAGETELKIITDNAYRYAMVYRGVAVGIKLLRDVFEALTLHTPCIFLLEDIHAIGERRPFLISDNPEGEGKGNEFGSERQADSHEKNQVIYQLTKHLISHYKKPYKGDFSLLIPTNHFCFSLLSSVNSSVGSSGPKSIGSNRSLSLSPITNPPISISSSHAPSEPLAALPPSGGKGDGAKGTKSNDSTHFNSTQIRASSLQLSKNIDLAPPATSPFSVLVLKEEKKFKPKKIVKELPWGGLPGEQLANVSKSTYSVRVKVAILADMVLSNLSVKLDMITDLLVIIDSVKGNHGFAVFATTHVPYILDPALRRPGRFDETISLPQIPSLLSRMEILKSNLTNLSNSSLNFGEPGSSFPIGVSLHLTDFYKHFSDFLSTQNTYNSHVYAGIVNYIQKQKFIVKKSKEFYPNSHAREFSESLGERIGPRDSGYGPRDSDSGLLKSSSLINLNSKHKQSLEKKNFVSKLYHYQKTAPFGQIYNLISQLLISLSTTSRIAKEINTNKSDFSTELRLLNVVNINSLLYTILYSSPQIFKQHLTILMAGKLGELFTYSGSLALGVNTSNYFYQKDKTKTKDLFAQRQDLSLKSTIKIPKNLEGMGLMSAYGIDETWRTATSLIFSFIQKRWLYQKNLIVPKFLDFGPEGYKKEIPSPPSSNILLPARRYENYKRTFIYSKYRRKTELSITEKIVLHQQQRLVKRLYNIPLKEYFRSEILSQGLLPDRQIPKNLSFANAPIVMAALENKQHRPTSISHSPYKSANWYFRNRILNRHYTYLSNQWWNGQLQEHNSETTFLSDIDWRYSYLAQSGPSGLKITSEAIIDFPDAEQFYNHKTRRWINTNGSWNYWFDYSFSDSTTYKNHYIFECMTNAYKCLDQNRELLDYYVISVLEKGKNLNEFEIITLFKHFEGFSSNTSFSYKEKYV
jgi:hypothetical protein